MKKLKGDFFTIIYRSYLKMRSYQIQRERYSDHMAGPSKACAQPFKGRNRDSPLKNPHRAKKAREVANSQLHVQWVYPAWIRKREILSKEDI